MRVKTDSRRQAILDTALALFREVGYERASMAAIAARVGGSKGTLYNYFKNKDDLFAAAMVGAMEEQGIAMLDLLDSGSDDVRVVLCRFGAAYVRFLSAPEHLSIVRTVVSEGANATLGAQLYELGPKRGAREMAGFVLRMQEQGKLRQGDPMIVGAHLRALLEAGIYEPQLFGAAPDYDIETAVALAVEAFLRAYGLDPAAANP
ncbi:TetR/AcrR family transcriptional regulator [Novosphingobium sp. KA1]|uniref:TetR/AcrR family transcriptional regulator n=1 Tax=Novosphingobium sp. (strain KA1) TaxID=164608 RepID=UPI001A8E468C|nr:TetR/AcrR family transcriptional regulator [Novosphingobium sp. KA1]QSR20309.1 hypothetical protein CA833_24570 [Novosphingobium sp. KA1]